MSTPISTIPNRPANKPVFDYQLDAGYARVPLTVIANDGDSLTVSGWAYQIDANGLPVLDAGTAAPIATKDSASTIALSGVLAKTHTLYDGWCKYVPAAGETISADSLPEGWTSGAGAPASDPAPAYGTCYFDTTAGQGWTWTMGEFQRVSQGMADTLQQQIDTTEKLAQLGI
ncbi:MAG TPA: hypothetical protein VFP88_02190 [Rhodanobacteraceae bacterium]|nr:hypothetical protein [Rhodanobacteraceae bacterium]